MVKYFFVIIKDEDAYRFNLFLNGKLKSNNYSIWGFLPTTIQKYWPNLQKNDIIFFGNQNLQFHHMYKLFQKKIDQNLPGKLFGTDFRSKALTHILMFTTMSEVNIGYSEMLRMGDLKNEPNFGIYAITKKHENELIDHIKKSPTIILNNKKTPKKIKNIILPVDYDGAPEKTKETVIRFIRDTEKTKKLKKLYGNRCQICNYVIEAEPGKYYSEVHHIWPLNLSGEDNFNNMLVLCPTHHAELDYGVIGIDENCTDIINKNGKKIGALIMKKSHKIDRKNVLFHLKRMHLN